MTPPADNGSPHFDDPTRSTLTGPQQLRAHVHRWTQLCDDLTGYADELRTLRGEISQRESATAEEEREIEERDAALKQREADVERRQREVEKSAHELEQQRRRALRHQFDGMRASQVNDRRFLRAAKLELHAKQRCNDADALLEQYEAITSELAGMTREIDDEYAQFAAAIDELLRENPAA